MGVMAIFVGLGLIACWFYRYYKRQRIRRFLIEIASQVGATKTRQYVSAVEEWVALIQTECRENRQACIILREVNFLQIENRFLSDVAVRLGPGFLIYLEDKNPDTAVDASVITPGFAAYLSSEPAQMRVH